MIDRCPNMLRHDFRAVGPCTTCGVSFAEGAGTACPGKPKAEQTPAPRIDLVVGDAVTYPAAGGGVLESLYEGHSGRLVGAVRLAGWFWDETDQCYCLEDTGVSAALPIRAADLRKKGGA